MVIANKVKLSKAKALELAKAARHVYAGRGKKLVHFDMAKDPPTQAELLKNILGPSGNLRAPTIVVGKTMLVGFNQEAYEKVFG